MLLLFNIKKLHFQKVQFWAESFPAAHSNHPETQLPEQVKKGGFQDKGMAWHGEGNLH